MPQQVVTANRLDDGRVVWLAADGTWDVDVARAAVFADAGAVEAGLAEGRRAVDAQHVVEPYAVEVEAGGGRVRPTALRERIRADGPSVPLIVTASARAASA